jgi:hypothetical protein
MHLEGKLHQGYQKIREQLKEFREKQRNNDGRRMQRPDRSRSRERLRRDREAKERLAEESKDHFYYSSVRWGQSSNMPKLGSIFDQSRIKFSDLVTRANDKHQDQLPTL